MDRTRTVARLPIARMLTLTLTLTGCAGVAAGKLASAPSTSDTGGSPPTTAELASVPPAAPGQPPPAAVEAPPSSKPCEHAAVSDDLDAASRAALEDFVAGRRLRALRGAEAALRLYPHARAAGVVARAAEAQLHLDRDLATARARDGRPVPLPAIALQRSGPPPSATRWLRIESKVKNLITDDADWLERNGLQPVVLRGRRAPAVLPHELGGHRLSERFVHGDHEVATYGPRLAVAVQGAALRTYDASVLLRSGPVPFEVTFAQHVGGRLVVQLAYNGYAERSGGRNAYLAAFDASTGALLWSSAPLVGGRSNFVVSGDMVISGYGFTQEPDFLFVHALSTGVQLQKLRLDSGPSALLVKDGRLHVRTYDRDYILSVSGGLSVVGEPTAEAPSSRPVVQGAQGGYCWATHGLAAAQLGDAPALRAAIDAYVGEPGVSPALVAELESAHGALLGGSPDDPIDLQRRPAVVVERAPFARLAPKGRVAPASPPPRLRQLHREKASPVRGPERPGFDGRKPFYLPPVREGRLPAGAPGWIPQRYGVHALRAVIPSGTRTLLIHGGRYLTSVRDREVEQILDLEVLRHPPRANPQWKEFAVQDVTYAQVEDGTLYVCNGGGSYAREVYGKKGFLTALDLASGHVLWRSRPLVCNADFVVLGDYLVTGYGFTAEPDRLHVVRLADGKVVQKLPLTSAPDSLRVQGGHLIVECYGHRHVFEVRKPTD